MATPAQQLAGFQRRHQRINARIEWFGNKVATNINIGMRGRLRLAAQLLRDRTVANISRPVTKSKGPRSGRIRVEKGSRSKVGEFPKADTTRLMKDIFFEVSRSGAGDRAIVGTTLDYGLLLETTMKRSFLRRTLKEMRSTITKVLTSGKGGGRNVQFRDNNE